MYENLPLFGVNVKIWLFLGFIQNENYHKAVLCSILPISTNICQFLNIYMMWGNFTELVLSLFMTTILFNSWVRIVIVMRNEEKFVKFMKEVDRWFKEAERRHDEGALKLLNTIAERTQFLSKFSLIFGTIGAIATVLFPFLLTERKLPHEVYVPGLDILKSPLYEVAYVLQTFLVMPFIMSTYVPFTNLFLSWLMFGIGLLQDLRSKLDSLHDKSEREMLEGIKECIKYHKKIIRFSENLEELVSFVSLMEFMLFSVMLCVLLFFILMVDDFMLQFTASIYVGCIFYVIFLSYWHANEFSCESLKIAEAAYNVDWINGSQEFRKCVLIMIARSQSALEICAGGLYPMTLEAFQSLLNASYSYLTFMQGFSGQN